MKNISFLKCLLEDAENELKYIEQYLRKADEAETDPVKWEAMRRMRVPSKEQVKDNLRMIRRITLDIEKELNK